MSFLIIADPPRRLALSPVSFFFENLNAESP
jgi:hypothetical protein